jgi:predicted heme/steroid binding protein
MNRTLMKHLLAGMILPALLLAAVLIPPAQAKERYAEQTGKGCVFCHEQSTGGALNTIGIAYIRNGYDYPIPPRVIERARALDAPFHSVLRFVLGYLHLLAGVVFFGAIFYIHIFIRPSRLTGGLPKHERMLGLSCMVVLAVTGGYLTWVRVGRWEQFFDNTFGLMLFIKICLFLLMVALGLLAVTTIHRRMKAEAMAESGDADEDEITGANLSRFDGTGGKPAYVATAGVIYDVTESGKWKDGRHFGKHAAGADLTSALDGAPHGAEVLERFPRVGETGSGGGGETRLSPVRRVFMVFAYANLVIVFLILACIAVWRWDFPVAIVPEKRPEAVAARTCIGCHSANNPGLYADWTRSTHAAAEVNCATCHQTEPGSPLVQKAHLENTEIPIQVVVTPKTCAGCHPDQAAQYARSKHAHTREIMWDIDPWLNDGMNSELERASGCYACHGTRVRLEDGRPVAGTWPNVGVGRVNPDGSRGSCSSCHTRHRFSTAEARKPEACDQCHLGPDHPQIEIYNESKHGTLYHAEGDQWTFLPEDGEWRAGRDFRAPTCAVCHMSAAPGVPQSHDVTERLAWETQAPLTIRPSEFEPFPAPIDWKAARANMHSVCLQCHSNGWANAHFRIYDGVLDHYNETYYLPAKAVMDDLYDDGLLSREPMFDEALEWEFYELWHHEGRRARMGAAMMAPDYAWWHGFYELKHRFGVFMDEAEKLQAGDSPTLFRPFPGKFRPQ